MSDFLHQALTREPEGAPHWLHQRHRLGRHQGGQQALPSRRDEAWKYTSLRALEEGGYLAHPEAPPPGSDLGQSFAIADLDAHRLVFVNGRLDASLSGGASLPAGVTLVPFSRASTADAALIHSHLGSLADGEKQPFVALNDSWLGEGVFLRVAANTRVTTPIQLVWLTAPQSESFALAQRLLVVLETGSEVAVVEHFASTAAAQNVFTTGVSELVVGANARLHHYRLHLEEASALHIGTVHASLARDALLNGFHLALGSPLKRIDLVVRHRGEGAHCELNGIYLPRRQEQVDYHTCMEHEVPHTSSEETFRGIIADRARAVFNGRIHIHRDAQKTSAHLSNRNLLTSNTAEVDTKPELEIYADDVQCSHGATVSQLDANQLYYLLTRGIPRQDALALLSFGFINEILNHIQHEPLRHHLQPQLAALFGQDPEFARDFL